MARHGVTALADAKAIEFIEPIVLMFCKRNGDPIYRCCY
jgi:hypothetical protein